MWLFIAGFLGAHLFWTALIGLWWWSWTRGEGSLDAAQKEFDRVRQGIKDRRAVRSKLN